MLGDTGQHRTCQRTGGRYYHLWNCIPDQPNPTPQKSRTHQIIKELDGEQKGTENPANPEVSHWQLTAMAIAEWFFFNVYWQCLKNVKFPISLKKNKTHKDVSSHMARLAGAELQLPVRWGMWAPTAMVPPTSFTHSHCLWGPWWPRSSGFVI